MAARAAGLRYVSDAAPGISRRRAGRGFTYRGQDGRRIDDPEAVARIRALAVPPAWTDVWISPISHSHLQATGRDARGRKQYRYHARWQSVREETKFHRLVAFGEALPAIRGRVRADLSGPGIPREKVLAAVVRLLDLTMARIGSDAYARLNGSYGLTTLQDQHVQIEGERLRFRFRAKGGKLLEIDLENPRLARVVKRCQDLPGQRLFQYLSDDDEVREIGSEDVNDYIREAAGEEFTAKDFRTWSGTVLGFWALQAQGPADSTRARKARLGRAFQSVAAALGNTPAIARKHYVHPAIVDSYLAGNLPPLDPADLPESPDGLRSEELAVLSFLRTRCEERSVA